MKEKKLEVRWSSMKGRREKERKGNEEKKEKWVRVTWKHQCKGRERRKRAEGRRGRKREKGGAATCSKDPSSFLTYFPSLSHSLSPFLLLPLPFLSFPFLSFPFLSFLPSFSFWDVGPVHQAALEAILTSFLKGKDARRDFLSFISSLLSTSPSSSPSFEFAFQPEKSKDPWIWERKQQKNLNQGRQSNFAWQYGKLPKRLDKGRLFTWRQPSDFLTIMDKREVKLVSWGKSSRRSSKKRSSITFLLFLKIIFWIRNSINQQTNRNLCTFLLFLKIHFG